MKTTHILSAAAVLAILTSGAMATTQSANAQSITQKATSNSIEIGSVYFQHYNMFKVELKTPISANDYYVDVAVGENGINEIESIIEDGYYTGFNFKMDKLVKKYPTTAAREMFYDALSIRQFSLSGTELPKNVKLENQMFKNELFRYQYLGNIVSSSKATNIIKGSSFNKFFKKDTVHADHTLENGQITTRTQGLQFELNQEVTKGYTYSVKAASGNIVGKTLNQMNIFFVKTNGKDFLPQEHTLTAKSNTTGEVYVLAKFTPFNIF